MVGVDNDWAELKELAKRYSLTEEEWAELLRFLDVPEEELEVIIREGEEALIELVKRYGLTEEVGAKSLPRL